MNVDVSGLELLVRAIEHLRDKPRSLSVGSRVRVYWKGDKCYYHGVVDRVRYHVKYDDNDQQWESDVEELF
jgi:hypothetical protein